jgi:hypothetical protein
MTRPARPSRIQSSAIEMACVVDAQAAFSCVRPTRADVLRELGVPHRQDLEQEAATNGSVPVSHVLDQLRVAGNADAKTMPVPARQAQRPSGRDPLLPSLSRYERTSGTPASLSASNAAANASAW